MSYRHTVNHRHFTVIDGPATMTTVNRHPAYMKAGISDGKVSGESDGRKSTTLKHLLLTP